MPQTPRQSQQQEKQRAAVAARRHTTRREREQRRQRQILVVSGAAIGLALLALIAGVAYEQLWLPSRPVASVGSVTLTRGQYNSERRAELASNIGQSLYLATFGEQFAQQFLGQIGQLDAEVPQIGSGPPNDATVSNWVDSQVIEQRAAGQFGIQVADAAVAQALVTDYGAAFAPTTSVTPTVGTLPTLPPLDAATPAAGTPAAGTPDAGTPAAGTPAAGTPAATATPAGPTATPSPSPTPAPTNTAVPTPQADEALRRQDEVLNKMFENYKTEITRIDPQRRPRLTLDDFRAGVLGQFRRQVLVEKVQEQLVPDQSFTPSTEPSNIRVRHILFKVTSPTTGTTAPDSAYEAARPKAEEVLAKALSGSDFEALAIANSEDYNTRNNGGELPAFDSTGKTQSGTQIDPAIVAAVANLQPDQVAPQLVRTPFGWHIVQLVERKVDSREDQLRTARTTAFDKWLQEQRATLTVQRFPAVTATPTEAPTGTPAALPTAELGGNPSPTPPPTPSPIAAPGTVAPAATAAPTPTP